MWLSRNPPPAASHSIGPPAVAWPCCTHGNLPLNNDRRTSKSQLMRGAVARLLKQTSYIIHYLGWQAAKRFGATCPKWRRFNQVDTWERIPASSASGVLQQRLEPLFHMV